MIAAIDFILSSPTDPPLPADPIPSIDPVIDAVEAYRVARKEYDEAEQNLAAVKARLSQDVMRSPRTVLGRVAGPQGTFKEKSAFSHHEIDRWFEQIVQAERRIVGDQFDAAQFARMRAEAHASLDADAAAVSKAHEESGFAAATERCRRANDAEISALEAVCASIPTTIAGAHALLTLLLIDNLFDDFRELQIEGFRSVQQSLASFTAA